MWYEGVMVMGTKHYTTVELNGKYGRPKSANQFAFPNYVACAPRSYKGIMESLCKRMICRLNTSNTFKNTTSSFKGCSRWCVYRCRWIK